MSENAIDSVKATPEPAGAKPKRKPGKKAKPAKKASRVKKPAAKPKADRTNKRVEVIAMMKRANGATLSEIMNAAVSATGVDFWGSNWDYTQSACESRLSSLGLRGAFRRMDAARLEFPDESFDVVVSVMCFHEVRAPSGVTMRGPRAALSEALRVLRPGGVFVFVDRFDDAADYGNVADLAAVLRSTTGLRRESLVATLSVPGHSRRSARSGRSRCSRARNRSVSASHC